MSEAIRTCPSCGAKNRLGAGAPPAKVPTCGRCHQPLPWVVDAGDDSFERELGSPAPVLVDFWAAWCGPCRAVAPVLEQLAAKHAGKLKVVKVDVDASPRTAGRFRIQSIPTLMLFRGGRVEETILGAQSQAALEQRLRPYLVA